RSKQAIFEDAFLHFTEQADTGIAKRIFKLDDPVKKLEAWIDGWVDAIQIQSAHFIEIMIDFWAEGVRERQSTKVLNMDRIYSEYRIAIAGILNDGIAKGMIREHNTSLTAALFIGAMDGVALQWILDRNTFDLKEAAEEIKTTFIQGIRKR
ncbi:MAG: TetR family transcriptional regulator C-terminal domain-containing protein, partial [Bacteroidales bacterium]|nr:TetR family transcriptional regulator C-terminal domain-containing protein [Bacteroidales bacterium]